MITYDVFWKTLKDRKISQYKLLNTYNVSRGLLYRMKKNELIFLDIDMPIKTGIDVIQELEKIGKSRNIVLITSYDHLVLASLSYRPFQIIRKIKMEEEIPKALQAYMQTQKIEKVVIEFSGKGFLCHIEKEKIEYLEKYKNNVIIHLVDEPALKIRDSIQHCEERLSEYGFLRVHVGYIVNIQRCAAIVKNEIILRSGDKIPISREKLKVVKEEFMISRRY